MPAARHHVQLDAGLPGQDQALELPRRAEPGDVLSPDAEPELGDPGAHREPGDPQQGARLAVQ